MADTLLLIEDEDFLGTELVRHFSREGWDVVLHRDLSGARKALMEDGLVPLVVVSDMNLPDGNALDLLEECREHQRSSEWLFLTGYGTVADSVRALRIGAYDFLEKPCDQKRLDLVVTSAARSAQAQRRLDDHAHNQNRAYPVSNFSGSSHAASEVRDVLNRLINVSISALIIGGETGTGKGLVARILHNSGPRYKEPLVEVNCAALPRELLESELFGHERGAYTGASASRTGRFERADGGTIFLDEIGELSPTVQIKLLRVLQNREVERLGGPGPIEVDVRVVTATHIDLEKAVEAGTFRADLFYRLNVFPVFIPPLRERKSDIVQLADHFLEKYASHHNKELRRISTPAIDMMMSYHWPGNVRELENCIERAVILSADGVIHGHHLPPSLQTADATGTPVAGSFEVLMQAYEREILIEAVKNSRGNMAKASRLLGTTTRILSYRLQKLDIDPKQHKS